MIFKGLCRGLGRYSLLLGVLSGCSPSPQDVSAPLPRVAVLTIAPVQLDLTEDLPGRVAPVRIAEIRPQVSGIVQRRLFDQGGDVQAGQPLFEINPAPFRAEVAMAEAALLRAQAALARARSHAARLGPLVKADAISRQVYDDAVSQRQQAAAEVAQAEAVLSRRRLDLRFATVESPISGRIDQALVTEGALVASNDAVPMARVQQINKVYVDVRRPAASLEALQAIVSHSSDGDGFPVEILRSSGKPYEVTGHILFSGVNVDIGTGDLLLRVLVDNPQRLLLPGMFVRARVRNVSYPNALTVPQQAVVRIGGKPNVWTVDGNGRAHLVAVRLGELVSRNYRVTAGLRGGEKVVVEGTERLSEGVEVNAHAWLNAMSATADAPGR